MRLQRENNQKLIIILVLIICIYALWLRISFFSNRELTGDEHVQIRCAEMSFFDFIKALPTIEYCSYISGSYILTYPFARLFSYNKWGLTIPHIILTIVGFYLLYLICRSCFKTIWGYAITFTIVCFNATLIVHATVIRTYAVLPTLALAIFYVLQRMVDLNFDLTPLKKIGAIALFILAIWFHPYGIAMVFSSFIYFLGMKLHTPGYGIFLKKSLNFLTIVLIIAMPLWFISVFGPHVPYPPSDGRLHRWIDPFEFIPNPLVNIIGFLKAIFCNLIGNKKLYFLFIGTFFPFLIPYKDRYRQIAFLLIIVWLPIQLILLSDMWTQYWFMQRQFIWVMPLFAFFIGWVWDSFFYQFLSPKRSDP